jgi:hypothetical protein
MAAVFFISSFSLPTEAALLPRGVAFATALLIAPVIVKQWKHRPTEANTQAEGQKIEVPVYLGAILLIAYALGIYLLGYQLASALFSVVISRKMGLKNWIVTILLALILSVGTAYIFGTVFGVRLPAGLLFENL